ncbi:Na+/H+ antiporter subunit G [Nitrosomonas sp.]|uniref:Na+/H+ antiporter subunit G n=1 Tax=Nitrosomonas sp. TaxID=42353 RepID=UPI00208BDF72|nr:Na+/H+ antiporter subunit G [Nitrosomonas sp.]GJL75008.1 MAG: hypothetical protein NMNS02_11140 [Nitrosomonas sp.]
MLEYFLSFLILTGAIFTFIGSLGLVRLKDLYTRLHGPTKATTLGVGSLLIASAVYFTTQGAGISLHEFLITIFLLITAPVSAHLLAKTALHLDLPSLAKMLEKASIDQEVTDEKDVIKETDKTDATASPENPETAETPPQTEVPEVPRAPDQTRS